MAHRLARRDFMHIGFLGGLGLTLSDFFRLQARADQKFYESKEGSAKSVIFIFLPGGMAHQESFDPKPFAPVEYRGPLGSIETNVAGVRLGELWSQTAQVADKLAICRSMSHGEAAHERGTHNMFTGYRPSPALKYPSLGSVVSHEFGPRNNLPPYVCIPNLPNVYAGTGYLSSSFAGFSLGSDPAAGGFQVRDLNLPEGVDDQRFTARRRMLDAVNAHFREREKADALDAVDTFYERAYAMISSEKARKHSTSARKTASCAMRTGGTRREHGCCSLAVWLKPECGSSRQRMAVGTCTTASKGACDLRCRPSTRPSRH